jgi:hypothetical protein
MPEKREGSAERSDVVQFFAGSPEGLGFYQRVCRILEELGDYEVRVTKSQVAFRRKRGFAYLWIPERYLRRPVSPVVLSIALGRRDRSRRFKEVVHPSPSHWMHHLEIHEMDDIDDDVAGWLAEAAQRAG